MNLIIGGAYQGKLDYARETYHIQENDIVHCRETDSYIDFSKTCVDHIEEFVLSCVRSGQDPVAYFKQHWEDWRQSVLICNDLSCGVVPLDPVMRKWRNETGRLCQFLSREASSVSRIFCGLEQKLK